MLNCVEWFIITTSENSVASLRLVQEYFSVFFFEESRLLFWACRIRLRVLSYQASNHDQS